MPYHTGFSKYERWLATGAPTKNAKSLTPFLEVGVGYSEIRGKEGLVMLNGDSCQKAEYHILMIVKMSRIVGLSLILPVHLQTMQKD